MASASFFAPSSVILFLDMFSSCSVLFTCMASASLFVLSSVILFLDMLSSLSVSFLSIDLSIIKQFDKFSFVTLSLVLRQSESIFTLKSVIGISCKVTHCTFKKDSKLFRRNSPSYFNSVISSLNHISS